MDKKNLTLGIVFIVAALATQPIISKLSPPPPPAPAPVATAPAVEGAAPEAGSPAAPATTLSAPAAAPCSLGYDGLSGVSIAAVSRRSLGRRRR